MIKRSFLILGLIFILSCGGKNGFSPSADVVSIPVGPAGATVTTPDGRARLVIPSGALASETTITVQPSRTNLENLNLLAGSAYDFGPEGLQFEKPVQLNLQYNEEALPQGASEDELAIVKVDSQIHTEPVLVLDDNIVVNTQDNRITADINGFSTHAVYCCAHRTLNVPQVRVTNTYSDAIELEIKRAGDVTTPSPSKIQFFVKRYVGQYRTRAVTTESYGGGRYPVSAICIAPQIPGYEDEDCEVDCTTAGRQGTPVDYEGYTGGQECRSMAVPVGTVEEAGSGDFRIPLSANPGPQLFYDNGLAPNTGYNYLVYTCYDFSSLPANYTYYRTYPLICSRFQEVPQVTLTRGPGFPLPPPGDIAVVNALPATTLVNLAWTASERAQSYLVEYSSDGGTTWTAVPEIPGSTRQTNISGLAPATQYIFRVRGKNPAALGNSTSQSTTTLATPLGGGSNCTGAAVAGNFNGTIGNDLRIAAGPNHVVTVANSGELIAWGCNDSGQLGDGTTTSRNTPMLVSWTPPPSTSITHIAAGRAHTLIRLSNGQVWGWGDNTYGQLGSTAFTQSTTPVQITFSVGGISHIAAGADHNLAIDVSAQVLLTWGRNDRGQLGIGSADNNAHPIPVAINYNGASVSRVYGGGKFSFAALSNGSIRSWGANERGQLCSGGSPNGATVPADILTPSATEFENGYQFALGDRHVVAARLAGYGDGSSTAPVMVCGDNSEGQLGLGTIDLVIHDVPEAIPGLLSNKADLAVANPVVVWTSETHTLIKTPLGMMSAGRNNDGALGRGGDPTVPLLVGGDFASGLQSPACALGTNFSICGVYGTTPGLYGWGINDFGQLGNPAIGAAPARLE